MKKEEKTELTKERILAAALKEFGEKGYYGASLNTICSAGISKGLLYHNFENKDAVYLACMERCFARLTEYLRSQEIGSDMRRYTDARLHFFQENEYEARMFFEAILQPPAALEAQVKEVKKDFDELNREICSKILETIPLRRGITRDDVMEHFDLMQRMFNGYFSSPSYNQMGFQDVMKAHELNLTKFLDFLLYGIAERRETL